MAQLEVVSQVVHVNQAIGDIYGFISDFNKVGALVNMVKQMGNLEGMATAAGAKAEDMAKAKEMVENVRFTSDMCYIQIKNMGEIALQILEKEEPKVVKLGGVVPFEYYLWIQLISDAPYETRLRLTFKGEMNMVYKMMLKGKLEKGLNAFAEGLTKIPFSMFRV